MIPFYFEIAYHAISIFIYQSYPLSYELGLNDHKKMYINEVSLIVFKAALVLICYLNLEQKSVWFFWMCLLLTLLIGVANTRSGYQPVFDPVVCFTNLFLLCFLCLFLMKVNGVADVGWVVVFLGQLIAGYLALFAFSIAILGWTCLAGVLLFGRQFRFLLLGMTLAMILNLLIFAAVMLGAIRLADPSRIQWIGNYTSILYTAIAYHVVYVLVVLFFGDEVNLQALTNPENKVERKTGLNYILNIMQVTPTYFATQGTPAAANQTPGAEGETSECIICCTNPSNCVIFDCMHSGVCSECADNVLKKNSKCMICRKQISKIAVVQKQSDNQYLVTDEIYINT